jgi:NAD(P)-dependent dehydrogenase (short-subunit alcohol dehydrogenase family)
MSEKETAIITGASRGIGAGLVDAFLKRGYSVVAGLQLQRSGKPLRIRRKQSRPCNGPVDSCLRVGRNAGSTLRLLIVCVLRVSHLPLANPHRCNRIEPFG